LIILPGTEIQIVNDQFDKGRIKHVIFDFDGTISLLREGWESIMEPVMIACVCGNHHPTPKIIRHVRRYIDETTGLQTILQMQDLVLMVKKYGLVPSDKVLDKWGYKRLYNESLMKQVRQRIHEIETGRREVETFTLRGALDFCKRLFQNRMIMSLASGTDHEDVQNEAVILQVAEYFKGGIYGAMGSIEAYSKDKVMKEILKTHDLRGSELLVIGDGPVEILNAKSNGAIAIGIASDEVKGKGWNQNKIRRLVEAGCDILMPDFSDGNILFRYLFE